MNYLMTMRQKYLNNNSMGLIHKTLSFKAKGTDLKI